MPAAIPFLVVTYFGLEGVAAAFVYIVATVAIGVYTADRAEAKARKAARDAAMERTVTVRSGVAPRRLVLGTARTGGVLTHGDFIGPRKRYLDMVLAFSANQLSSIEGFFFGDEFVAIADVVDGVPVKGQYSITGADATDTSSVGIIYRTIGFGTSNGSAQTFTVDYDIASSDPNLIKVEGTRIGSEGGDYALYTVASISGRTITTTQPVFAGLEISVTFPINGYEHPLANGDSPPMRLQWRLGTPDQDAMLWTALGLSSEKWTADHRLRGVSCLRALMDIEANAYKAGEPNINILARGPVGVYDPRTGTTINGTSNPALLAAWYRTLPRPDGGMGIPSSWIDWATVAAAANICDEQIQVRNTAGELVWVKRYECNTVLSLDQPRNANLREILNCMAGEFPFTAGMYRCYAGAFRPAAITLTDADIAAEDAIQFGPAGSTFDSPPNVVNATFTDAANNYLDNSPSPVVNDDYVTLDGGEEILDLQLTGVTDANRAHYLMGVRLEQARPAMAGVLSVRGRGADLALMETVQLQLQGYESLAGRTFEIRRRENAWNGRYRLEMAEVRPNTWLLNADSFTPQVPVPRPDTSGRWRVEKVTSLGCITGTSTLQLLADGTILARARLVWDAHPNAYVHDGGRIEVRYRPLTGDEWVYLGPLLGDSTETLIGPLVDGQYYAAEVRAVNAPFGAASKWERITFRAVGKSAPPRNVPSIAYAITTDGVVFTVPLNDDLDRDLTELRVGGLDWDSAAPLVGDQPTRFAGTNFTWPRPAAGNYRVRARYIDTSGNDSLVDTTTDLVIGAAEQVLWGDIGGKPKAYRMVSTGNNAENTPHAGGLYDGETDARLADQVRSYRLIAWSRETDAIVHSQTYDVFGAGELDGRPAADLAADLNYFASTTGTVRAGRYILGLFTGDEPRGNRLTGGLLEAIKRNGGSQEIFGGSAVEWKYRPAYSMLSISGCGEGNAIVEAYRGDVDFDGNAWIDVSFQIYKGQVLGVASSASATRGALLAANAAKAQADTARSNADAALADLANISSDNVLSRVEKARAIQDWNVLATEQAGIDAQADNYGVTSEKYFYDSAVGSLASYLVSLSPGWSNLSADTPIDGNQWRAAWTSAYTARQAVLDKIAANAKARLGGLATLNAVNTDEIVDAAVIESYDLYDETGYGVSTNT